ncbi:endonuclease V [Streptomyces sp. NRRL F-5755]|uniref:endonuclease V n=1 Tax=Streptomyces sp. NRRL F-5755 TaxID=1519475 RepID=UPI0006AFDF80|nr:endonuclease V [Streptomyces sp. NRRL F-5755]KOT92234.1 endonuclease V [Streptomyces sp. NRRL F-5755]
MTNDGTISLEDELAHWPTDETGALAVQDRLRAHVRREQSGPEPGFAGTVVGVDVAYDDEHDLVAAAAVALDAVTLAVVEEATAVGRVSFPYVPGLLAFREIPTVVDALGRLGRTPDLVVCDGYGFAHPRRFGLASHLGVLTGLPTIGVAKNPFTSRYELPGVERGESSPLVDGSGDGTGEDEVVGRALRTQKGVKPVFVSIGHRIDLDRACAHTLHLSPKYRIPETTRAADALCRRALSEARAG